MTSGKGTTVATRHLKRSDGALIVVSIGKPRRKGHDWVCTFVISDGDNSNTGQANGVDAVQALTQALEGVRTALEVGGDHLTWVGGEPGDNGFARTIPQYFGIEFSQRVGHLLDREIAKFSNALARRRKAPKTPRTRRT